MICLVYFTLLAELCNFLKCHSDMIYAKQLRKATNLESASPNVLANFI